VHRQFGPWGSPGKKKALYIYNGLEGRLFQFPFPRKKGSAKVVCFFSPLRGGRYKIRFKGCGTAVVCVFGCLGKKWCKIAVARVSLSKMLVNGHDKMQEKVTKERSYKTGTELCKCKGGQRRRKTQKAGLISLLGCSPQKKGSRSKA
jgi:hypothetical protein